MNKYITWKNIRNSALAAWGAGAIGLAFVYKAGLEDRRSMQMLEHPYTIGVDDRFGYLKALADEDRNGSVDKEEGAKMHKRMNVEGMHLIAMDMGAVPENLRPYEEAIERAIDAY
ncbi:MAG TPA: hypothetical protein VI968_02675 [archaeon]|nr:hypothetical protein [archaeon]